MTAPTITDHVYRADTGWRSRQRAAARQQGKHGGPRIDPGGCWYLTSCNRPAADHLPDDEYRRRRDTT